MFFLNPFLLIRQGVRLVTFVQNANHEEQPARAAAALGTLTGLVFKKPEKILQNITWLKAF